MHLDEYSSPLFKQIQEESTNIRSKFLQNNNSDYEYRRNKHSIFHHIYLQWSGRSVSYTASLPSNILLHTAKYFTHMAKTNSSYPPIHP